MAYAYGLQGAPVVGNGLGGLPRRATSSGGGSQGLQYAETSMTIKGNAANNDYVFKSSAGNAYAFPSLIATSGLVNTGKYRVRTSAQFNYNSSYSIEGAAAVDGRSGISWTYGAGDRMGGSMYFVDALGNISAGSSTSNGQSAQNAPIGFSPDGSYGVCAMSWQGVDAASGSRYFRREGSVYVSVSTSTWYFGGAAVNNQGRVCVCYTDGSGNCYAKVYSSADVNTYTASLGYRNQAHGVITTSDNKFLAWMDNIFYLIDPVANTSTSYTMPDNIINAMFTNAGDLLWVNKASGSYPNYYHTLRRYAYPAMTLTQTYSNFYRSDYAYKLYMSQEPTTNRIAVGAMFGSTYIYESDLSTLYYTIGDFLNAPLVFNYAGGFFSFYGNANGSQIYRYEHTFTNNDSIYLAGVALETPTQISRNGVPVRVQTSGVKSSSADFRSVGGIALISLGLTP